MIESVDGFEVTGELGRGGMGVVYEARHPDLDRPVALKLLLGTSDPDALLRFGREAELLARVRHPGVLRIHKLGRSAQGPYLVTELLEGEDLGQLTRQGPLEPRRAAEIVRALADALQAVHAEGVIHRDLKPENVVVRPDGSPVLLDFGVARDVTAEKLTQTGAVLGTPAYMAPEQADGNIHDLSERSDVYGLGAILFRLLSARAPFEGEAHMTLVKKVLLEEPRWPSADGDVPADLEAICQRAMAKEPAQRYPSAVALRDDLDRYLAGDPVEASPRRRRGRKAPLVVAGLVCLAGLVALAAWSASPEPAPPAPSSDPPRPPRAARPPGPAPLSAAEVADGRRKLDALAGLKDVKASVIYDQLGRWLEAHANHPDAKRARDLQAQAQLGFPLLTLTLPEAERPSALVMARWVGNGSVLTGDPDRRLRLYDLSSPSAFQGPDFRGRAFDVTPDGQFVVVAVGKGRTVVAELGGTRGWDLKTAPRGEPKADVAFSPSGKLLGIASPRAVHVLAWPERTLLRRVELPQPRCFAISPSGTLLAVGGGTMEGNRLGPAVDTDYYVTVVDVGTGAVRHRSSRTFVPSSLVFARDNERLLVGDYSGKLECVDLEDGGRSRHWTASSLTNATDVADVAWGAFAHVGWIVGMAFSADGSKVFTAGAEPEAGTFRVWSYPAGEELRSVRRTGLSLASFDVSPDGSRLLLGTDRGTVEVYAVEAD